MVWSLETIMDALMNGRNKILVKRSLCYFAAFEFFLLNWNCERDFEQNSQNRNKILAKRLLCYFAVFSSKLQLKNGWALKFKDENRSLDF